MTTIRVLARPGVLVPSPRARGIAAYIGRDIAHDLFKATYSRHDGVSRHLDTVEEDQEKLFPIKKEATEFSSRDYAIFCEIARAVRHGDLLPADQASASFCGVKTPPASKAE